MSLNQSQKMAVCHKDGPALVLAGPGSGKTMVITHRIKELIDTYGAAPGEILVITFTRAAAAEMNGPCYLRFTRDAIPVIYDENTTFEIGKANLLKDGKDVAIIANGDTVRLALEAAEVLAGKGISARVLDMHTIKPLDVEAVKACVNDIGKIITVEDHNIINGLGGAVCEVVAEMGKGQVKRVGIQDQFGQSAPYERLLAINGITVENIVAQAENW